jgi:hypothetical protein
MICFEFVEWGRKVIDRMVGVLERCRLVWTSGISVYPSYDSMRGESKSIVRGGTACLVNPLCRATSIVQALSSDSVHHPPISAQIYPSNRYPTLPLQLVPPRVSISLRSDPPVDSRPLIRRSNSHSIAWARTAYSDLSLSLSLDLALDGTSNRNCHSTGLARSARSTSLDLPALEEPPPTNPEKHSQTSPYLHPPLILQIQ